MAYKNFGVPAIRGRERQVTAARIRVSDEVLERFPSFRLRVLYAFGIRNRPSDATSREWLREGASRGLAALGGMRPGEHPHVKLWRDAYSAFGAKPSAYPCSAEALIQRVVKRGADAVPGINCLVDAYNAVSLAHLLPIGGEDLDRLVGPGVLRLATSKDANVDAATAADAPKPGEVIWADDVGRVAAGTGDKDPVRGSPNRPAMRTSSSREWRRR